MKSIFKLAICFLLCISLHFCFAQSPLDTPDEFFGFSFYTSPAAVPAATYDFSNGGIDFYNLKDYHKVVFGVLNDGTVQLDYQNKFLIHITTFARYISFDQFQFVLNSIRTAYGKEIVSGTESLSRYVFTGQKVMFILLASTDSKTGKITASFSWSLTTKY
jgi:hypothetical protein